MLQTCIIFRINYYYFTFERENFLCQKYIYSQTLQLKYMLICVFFKKKLKHTKEQTKKKQWGARGALNSVLFFF